ncbi:MAG: hypothetical protein ACI85I_001320 [Arenicella sp.]|jgi:hypothetical protein
MLEISKYISVITGSMLKFILGPVTGTSLGLSFLEIYFCTVFGMMATVVGITYFGTPLRNKIAKLIGKRKKRKVFTPRNRRIVKVWKQHGMKGVAFLTPLLLSPPFGTIIAVSFGEDKKKIIFYMFISAVLWGLVFTALVYTLGVKFFQEWLPSI